VSAVGGSAIRKTTTQRGRGDVPGIPRSSVRLHPLAEETLRRLKADLAAEFGLSATHEEIVAALLHGTTVPQLSGMLMEFTKHEASSVASEDEETPAA